jgi:hypothetical protein
MAKTKAELMRALREKRKAKGLKEVRGIWLNEELHERVKKYAEKVKAQKNSAN